MSIATRSRPSSLYWCTIEETCFWQMWRLSTSWRGSSSHSQWNFSSGQSQDRWEYWIFGCFLPFQWRWIFITKNDSVFIFFQNRESDHQKTERHMEVLLTLKIRIFFLLIFQQLWQHCTLVWTVLVHADTSVDCGWTCQVKFHTWRSTRKAWWQQQEQFT